MTVEQLIELLQEQNPQALVLVESDVALRPSHYRALDECSILDPYRLRTTSRDGHIYIICDPHDC